MRERLRTPPVHPDINPYAMMSIACEVAGVWPSLFFEDLRRVEKAKKGDRAVRVQVARHLVCRILYEKFRMTEPAIAAWLGMSQPVISRVRSGAGLPPARSLGYPSMDVMVLEVVHDREIRDSAYTEDWV